MNRELTSKREDQVQVQVQIACYTSEHQATAIQDDREQEPNFVSNPRQLEISQQAWHQTVVDLSCTAHQRADPYQTCLCIANINAITQQILSSRFAAYPIEI